ncbi:MAG: M48 family metallopeptidase [Polyangiaceae bacterium]
MSARSIAFESLALFTVVFAALVGDHSAHADEIDDEARAEREAPSSASAHLQRCQSYIDLEQRQNAVDACERALASSDTPQVENALARALMLEPRSSEDEVRAIYLAGLGADKGHLQSALTKCQIIKATSKKKDARRCFERLAERLPTSRYPHLELAALEAEAGNDDEAESQLDIARALGASDAELAPITEKLAEPKPLSTRVWRKVRVFLLVWLAVGLTVALLGLALSAATRHFARALPTEGPSHSTGIRALRGLYSAVLWVSCLLFYLTIPVMLGSTLIVAGGVIYAMFAAGRVYPYYLFLLLVMLVVTLGATVQGLFGASTRDVVTGHKLDLRAHPKLRALLEEVARKLETEPIQEVYLTPMTDLSVYERLTLPARLRGARGTRCLTIGAGVLKDMRLLEFKAVLAHEYGHFKNEDTAGGAFALAASRSLSAVITSLAAGGAATWYNPAWWLLKGFCFLFIRVAHGASRLQEILADRWAAFAYGAEPMERGLRHVVRKNLGFPLLASMTIDAAARERRKVQNLYRSKAPPDVDWEKLERAVEVAIQTPASPYATHPSPEERFALLRRLVTPQPTEEEYAEKAWSVFESRTELERALTRKFLGED